MLTLLQITVSIKTQIQFPITKHFLIFFCLQLIGIFISLATALTTVDKADATQTKETAKKTSPTKATVAPTKEDKKSTSSQSQKEATIKNASKKTELRAGALKSAGKAGENRGKRTLHDFGNPGYLYQQVAARRAGYEAANDASAGNSYYPQQNGYYNGQNAIGMYDD